MLFKEWDNLPVGGPKEIKIGKRFLPAPVEKISNDGREVKLGSKVFFYEVVSVYDDGKTFEFILKSDIIE